MSLIRLWAGIALCGLLGGAIATGRAPLWLAGIYGAMGLVSLTAYALDKAAARNGASRIRERTLHILDLCGGVIGGLLGQHGFRHKTAKRSFALKSGLIAATHAAALGALASGLIAWPPGWPS